MRTIGSSAPAAAVAKEFVDPSVSNDLGMNIAAVSESKSEVEDARDT